MALRVRTHIRTGQGSAAQTPPSPPSNTVAPAVTGTTTLGQTLSCSTGTWTNSPSLFTYQWIWADTNAPISGATSATYVLQAGDVGHTIKCAVTASNAGGSATANSNTTAAVTSGSISPDFQTAFTSISSLPTGVSFSRASNAMVNDSTGKLTYAPNNILLQSEDLTNAAWTNDGTLTVSSGVSDPDGGSNAFTLTATSANAYHYQSWNAVSGLSGQWVSSVWMRRRTGVGTIGLHYPDDTGNNVSISSTWTRVYIAGPVTANNPAFVMTIAVSGDAIDVYHPQLEKVTYETTPRAYNPATSSRYYGPRFDHAWNGSAWVAVGLLIEEQRTNWLLQSTALATAAWATAGAAKSTDTTTGPDGSTACKVTASAGAGSHEIYCNSPPAATSGANYAAAVLVKAGTKNFAYLNVQDGGAGTSYLTAVFDLSGTSDTVATQTSSGTGATLVSTKAQYVGNGWFRVSLVGSITTGSGTAYTLFGVANAATGNSFNSVGEATFTAAGTEYVYFVLPDFQAGSFITSTIPTTTAAVTRSADILSLAGAALAAIVGASVTAVVEFDTSHSQPPAYYAGFDLSGGANLTEFWSDGKIYVGTSTGQLILDTGIGSLVPNTNYRYGLAWDGVGASACGNGGTVATGAYSAPAVFTTATIGANGAGTANISSHIRSLAIYSSRLSDTDLQAKSVVGAAF